LEKKNAFVIMPFNNNDLDTFYKEVVKPTLLENGYEAKRVDEMSMKEQIVERIVHSIEDADLIICELTDKNPNVMYELGVAHSLTRKVIMIAKHDQDLPFDLKDYEVLFYKPSDKEFNSTRFRSRFNQAIEDVNKEGISNPVQKFSRTNNELMNVSVVHNRPIIPPLKVFQKIGPYIKEDLKSKGEPYGIAITGASCLGKTVFANELSKYLKENEKINSTFISLDGYMLPRNELERRGLSGHQEEAHDLSTVREKISKLMNNRTSIDFRIYDHATGLHHPTPIIIDYSPIVIMEGVIAFSDKISDFVKLKIFLEGEDQWVTKTLRFVVSLEQRSRTINNSRLSADREFSHYINYLADKRKMAQFVIQVQRDWSMKIASQ
jgi:uridine kinase